MPVDQLVRIAAYFERTFCWITLDEALAAAAIICYGTTRSPHRRRARTVLKRVYGTTDLVQITQIRAVLGALRSVLRDC